MLMGGKWWSARVGACWQSRRMDRGAADVVGLTPCAWSLLGATLSPGVGRRACSISLVLYGLPATGVKARVDKTVEEMSNLVAQPEEPSSLSIRVALWQGALQLALERPVLGHGADGFAQGMERLNTRLASDTDSKLSKFWHAHQDLLDAWSRRGILAGVGLLILYAIPLLYFARQNCRARISVDAARAAGLMVPTGFIVFGLSYSFLAYPVGVAVFATWVIIPWCLMPSRPS